MINKCEIILIIATFSDFDSMDISGDKPGDPFTDLTNYVKEHLNEFPPIKCEWYHMDVENRQNPAFLRISPIPKSAKPRK